MISQGCSGGISQVRNRRDQPEKEKGKSARNVVVEIRQGRRRRDQPGKKLKRSAREGIERSAGKSRRDQSGKE